MKSKTFIVKEKAQELSFMSGWVYVPVSRKEFLTSVDIPGVKKTRWGLIPIQAKIGDTLWSTSLLPMGDGSYFIALKAKIRKQESIFIGDEVKLHFYLK